MAGGYSVGIASETKAFEQGIKRGVIEPLEDAQDALKDLGRNDGPGDLERSMRDAQTATRKLDDEIADTRDSLERLGRSARTAGADGERGMSQVKDGAKEVQQEIGSNLGEAVSSFRGDLSDLGQVGQDRAVEPAE